jgi:small conductance mechanosensitive channel
MRCVRTRAAMRLVAVLLATLLACTALAAAPAAVPLLEQLHAVDGLERVAVRQQGGVVILEGEVLAEADRELAESIARSGEGVREVVNRVEISTRLGERIASSGRDSLRKFERFVGGAPLLLVAIAIALAFWWLTRWFTSRRWLDRVLPDNRFVADLVRHALRIIGTVLGAVIALRLLDAVALVGALLGSAGVIGIALGFAFRDLAENYIASILLSLRQPFCPNDHVVIDGNEGVVVGLNSRATILMTPAGNHLRLPNALVFKAVTLNYTRNPNRRFDFNLVLGAETSATTVLTEGLAELRAVEGVLAMPEPAVTLQRAARDAVEFQFTGWVDQRRTNFGWVRSEAIRRVRSRLRDNGVLFSTAPPPAPAAPAKPATKPATGAERAPRAAEPIAPPEMVAESRQPLAAGHESETDALLPAVQATRDEMGSGDLLKAGQRAE